MDDDWWILFIGQRRNLARDKEEKMRDRREFLKASGTLMATIGVLGLTRDVHAQYKTEPIQKAHPEVKIGQVTLDRNNLGLLSNNLSQSPAERQKFLSNPQGYAETFFKGKLDPGSAHRLEQFKQMLADGWCCHGCGCGKQVISVEMKQSR